MSNKPGYCNLHCVCVGPQRTASSWLDRALREHPRLSLPANVKETFFFDRHYDRGWEWYLAHFSGWSEGKLLAEVGPTYFECSESREHIRDAAPGAHIVVMVRNPIARSFSSFKHEYVKGRAPADFIHAIDAVPRIINSGRYSVLAPGWENAFQDQRFFYLVQEDIEMEPQVHMDAVFAFLGLDTLDLSDTVKGRHGQGTVPKFRSLAAVAARSASGLRRTGLHRVVEFGKRLGLKRIYEGGDARSLQLSRTIFDRLLLEHEADIQFLEDRLGRIFPHWRDPAYYGLSR